jgi:hypothetical protein
LLLRMYYSSIEYTGMSFARLLKKNSTTISLITKKGCSF